MSADFSSSSSSPSCGRLQFAQGALVAVAFSTLLIGSNATTPLLPIYRQELGFSPFVMTLTFVSYVAVLIATLVALSRTTLTRHAPQLVCLSLLMSIASDLLLATATPGGILGGRVLAGLAGGMGTGTSSALVVLSLGPKGRSVSATGNLIGAVVGTVMSQLCVSLMGSQAMHWTFLIHALLCTTVLAVLVPVLIARAQPNKLALHASPVRTSVAGERAKVRAMPLLIGCLAWVTLSSAVVLLPSYFAELHMPRTQTFGILLFLAASAIGQLSSRQLTRVASGYSGLPTIAVGICLMLGAALMKHDVLALLGFALLGAGVGISYRLCLVVTTKGASIVAQGALSSSYAAITYGAAAASVLGAGVIGNLLGLQATVTMLFAAIVVLSILMARHAPRLRDGIE